MLQAVSEQIGAHVQENYTRFLHGIVEVSEAALQVQVICPFLPRSTVGPRNSQESLH
jgi:hypothetical protein